MKHPEIVAAILGGSAIIALGLYFGLRARPGAVVASPAGATAGGANAKATPGLPQSAATPPQRPETPAAPPGVSAPPELVERVRKDVATALETQRPNLKKLCWDPLATKDPAPAKSKLTWNGTIGPAGKPLAYGVSDSRDSYRQGLIDCLSPHLADLTIAAPPQSVEVTVEFELP